VTVTTLDAGALAVVVVRDGRLPAGADEVTAEAEGAVLMVGSGVERAVSDGAGPAGAVRLWWAETPTAPRALADTLAPAVASAGLVLLPASPDGRDLAPLLAARTGRPLLAGAVRAVVAGDRVEADLLRVDGRVTVPVSAARPAVATLWPGSRSPAPAGGPPRIEALDLPAPPASLPAAITTEALVEPDPATMDLADAPRVLAGGAGLVAAGAGDGPGRAAFGLLVEVAAALGASAGATRVVTDAGWMAYDRQIGTTGVSLRPDLYVAFGISGASQHIGGIGDPRRVVSINLDPSCPMTGLADLGLVADAPGVLVELAARLGIEPPPELAGLSEETGRAPQ
jgi:electron transfer flavoprotein alpha subunit